MQELKTLIQIFTTVMILLFLPTENRVFLFNSNPETLYGEFTVATINDNSYTVIKNISKQKVQTNIGLKSLLISRNISKKQSVLLNNTTSVPPQSYSIIVHNKSDINRLACIAPGYYFLPQELIVVTKSEQDNRLILIFIIIGSVGFLAYLCTSHYYQASAKQEIE